MFILIKYILADEPLQLLIEEGLFTQSGNIMPRQTARWLDLKAPGCAAAFQGNRARSVAVTAAKRAVFTRRAAGAGQAGAVDVDMLDG